MSDAFSSTEPVPTSLENLRHQQNARSRQTNGRRFQACSIPWPCIMRSRVTLWRRPLRGHALTQRAMVAMTEMTRAIGGDIGRSDDGAIIMMRSGIRITAAVIAVIIRVMAIGIPARDGTFLIGRIRREIARAAIGRSLVDVIILMHRIGQPFIGPATAMVTTRTRIDRAPARIPANKGNYRRPSRGQSPSRPRPRPILRLSDACLLSCGLVLMGLLFCLWQVTRRSLVAMGPAFMMASKPTLDVDLGGQDNGRRAGRHFNLWLGLCGPGADSFRPAAAICGWPAAGLPAARSLAGGQGSDTNDRRRAGQRASRRRW